MQQYRMCPVCEKDGHDVRVISVSPRGSTVMGGHKEFWDPDGEHHSHDPNTTTQTFRCSRGHTWTSRWIPPCPAEECDYGGLKSRDLVMEGIT